MNASDKNRFFLMVEELVNIHDYSVSNAIKFLIKTGEYTLPFDVLKNKYYYLKRKKQKELKEQEYKLMKNISNTSNEETFKKEEHKPSFIERILSFFGF